ncbi:MAG: hypothetical protein HZB25_14000 [Candidatus Eisenbacteria bacterium]|nr:hypothetical protein [Candidatus Eisenbacteria bacterium]
MRNAAAVAVVVMCAVLLGPRVAAAQYDEAPRDTTLRAMARERMRTAPREVRPSRWNVGASLALGIPTGEFKQHVRTGFGLLGQGVYRLDPAGWLGLRVEGGVLIYGSERYLAPLSTTVGRVTVQVTTTNNVGLLGVGPRLGVPRGALRPYVDGSLGLGYFFTNSGVEGVDGYLFASDNNMSHVSLNWGLGGGVDIPLGQGPRGVHLDLSAHYRSHASAKYLPRGGIVEDGQGNVVLNAVESRADLVMVSVGVAAGVR